MRKLVTGLSFVLMHVTMGVCKTQTGYLRMAAADGKMRMEKNADNKKSKKEETRNADGKKNKQINKQTKKRNLSFKSLSHGWTLHLDTERDANS